MEIKTVPELQVLYGKFFHPIADNSYNMSIARRDKRFGAAMGYGVIHFILMLVSAFSLAALALLIPFITTYKNIKACYYD